MPLDFKKPQGTVRYKPQITKHDTDAILYFNFDNDIRFPGGIGYVYFQT